MHGVTWWAMVAALSVATFTDLRDRRIPNWLVFPLMGAGVVVCSWTRGWHGFEQSLEGFGLGALVYGILFVIGGMGMGDVKLVAAVGAWIGPGQLLTAIVITGIVGGIMALGIALSGGFLKDVVRGAAAILLRWRKRGTQPDPQLVPGNLQAHKMPYAPAIAIGTLMSFLVG